MKRVWLDASLKDDEAKMDAEPPVPPIPTLPPAHSVPRLRSLQLPTEQRTKRRSPNHVRNKPASPEVISSLIDSLAAISLPTNDRLDHSSGTDAAVAPTIARSAEYRASSDSNRWEINGSIFDVKRGAGKRYFSADDYIASEDAAEPPVVRTSRHPSGSSISTVSKNEHPLKNYLRSGTKSTTSLHSAREWDEDAEAVRNITGETSMGKHSKESPSIPKSPGKHKSLSYLTSQDRSKGKEKDLSGTPADVGNRPGQSPAPVGAPQTPRSRKPYRLQSAAHEEPPSAGPSRVRRLYSEPDSPISVGKRPIDLEWGSPVKAGRVPVRKSSLRHQDSPPQRTMHSRHSSNYSRQSSNRTETVREEKEPETAPILDVSNEGEDEDDNEVTRRIKELKAQKRMRDRATPRNTSTYLDYGVMKPEKQPIDRPAFSHASSDSSHDPTTIRRSISKAHRILGIDEDEAARPLEASPLVGDTTNGDATLLTNRVDSERPRTPHEDAAPLPVIYPLVKQTLDRLDAPSSRESRSTMASSGTVARSSSAIVGNRSSVASAFRHSLLLDATPPRRSSLAANGSSRASSGKLPSPPQNSLDEAVRKSTPMGAPELVAPEVPNRANSSKKKRWSHPDLPLKAEQKHNMRIAEQQMKTAQVPEVVVEERPSSARSVDGEVYAFVHAPRLSQKIRHPQTGRIISFSEVGDPQGYAVFCCVGMGLTRYVTAFYDELATTLKLRLITPDRPGVGESQIDPSGTPLSWADDISAICQHLGIGKFSIMAHSAGAIYGLATALRMPQKIRGRVHLLAPWIPPSQMSSIGLQQDLRPSGQMPKTQRFLRILPITFLRVANSTWMGGNSSAGTKTSKWRVGVGKESSQLPSPTSSTQSARPQSTRRDSIMLMDQQALPNGDVLTLGHKSNPSNQSAGTPRSADPVVRLEQERRRLYDSRLTLAIWDLATTNANPTVDLLVCLERTRDIGFRYVDINRAVVIHHGSRDTRVPVENVRWLGRTMRQCEVRILEGEGHGLMASATVMGGVLTEIAGEWEEWKQSVRAKEKGKGKERQREGKRRGTVTSK